ncbi:endo-1,4-beta-glucanase [Yamadazyma tenuis]|uniref:Glycoside hydrolase n=1 Tax=Candida tenuis (strain ATCC 10573 / BCRC 21748 / CBS 615 / JCM 9827 / NBRC 10315 / NRRL Y-1498 / VKM Y-70) TaxID=590646 RepID=G3BB79_CANTC|nr:glycoside hydrolase [Yamadazyma tenuis ATCC 10573]EGV61509.1 glycoside hydrolase [Yamadazyma tenuis ATCC 10573]WEJ92728.1 endo-1,4-beta-glucanase [Yamadazyma tenuis]
MTGFLKVSGTKIVDQTGTPVVLTGAATGGHLNMENFITGYPGHETEHKKVILSKIGQEKFDYFFDKFYEYFWTKEDANVNAKGFERLDRLVDTCAANGIYTILDLHTVPGGQCQQWFSDSPTHFSWFWDFKVFQDAIVHLWSQIAHYYKDNQWVAGYNPLNEPASSDHSKLVRFYERIEKAIRGVDPHHVLFLDGNTYAMDFSQFPDQPFSNSVYAIHDYTLYGFPRGLIGTGFVEPYQGTEAQKAQLQKQYQRKVQYMKQHGIPVWNGEFGPVYASSFRGDVDPEATNRVRYQVLKDQLEVYKHGDPSGDGSAISWSIWLYKDIGLQGLTYVSEDSKWFEVFGKWLQKKKKLGLDAWGNDIDPEYQKLYTRLGEHIKANVPEKYHRVMYPPIMDIDGYVNRVTREMLFSQYCQHEYADLFVGMDFDELDELAASFKLENCARRWELEEVLRGYSEESTK